MMDHCLQRQECPGRLILAKMHPFCQAMKVLKIQRNIALISNYDFVVFQKYLVQKYLPLDHLNLIESIFKISVESE